MTTFRYHAANAEDQPQSGVIDAATATDAARLLVDRGLYPVELSEEEQRWTDFLTRPLRTYLSTADIAQMLADLGHLLSAGLELAMAIATIAADPSKKKRRRDVLQHLLRDLRTGCSLSQAMSGAWAGFPAHVVAVVRAGEISGALPTALIHASNNLRRAALLRSKIRTALIYPMCVALAVAFVIVVLIGVVVPALESIFPDGLQRLPWQSRLLIVSGRFMREHALALAVFIVSAGSGCVLLLKQPAIRLFTERCSLHLPGVGSLLSAAETARLARSLALLSSSGLPLAKAITIAAESTRLHITQLDFAKAAVRVREGSQVHDALGGITVLGPQALALIRIGEITGRLNILLDEAARDAEERVATSVDRILALLTPAMTLLFGSIAGFVLYAVMTAILSVNELATVAR